MRKLQKFIITVCLCCISGVIVFAQNAQTDSLQIRMGYYSVPELTNTGAYASVSGEDLAKSSVARLSQALVGQLTGLSTLELNSGLTQEGIAKIIRGNSTINGASDLETGISLAKVGVEGAIRSMKSTLPLLRNEALLEEVEKDIELLIEKTKTTEALHNKRDH